jgi:hypothetical protein
MAVILMIADERLLVSAALGDEDARGARAARSCASSEVAETFP